MRKIILGLFLLILPFTALGQNEAKVIKTYTQIYAEPDVNSKVLDVAPKDKYLIIRPAGKVNGWYAVDYGSVSGWVIAADTELSVVSSYRGPVSTTSVALSPVYVNPDYGFSFTLPVNSKADKDFNQITEFLVSYICAKPECSIPGIFSVTSVKKLDVKMSEVVKGFQNKAGQDAIAKILIDSFPVESNITVLSKSYAAYKGRPALKIAYNFTANENSLTGTAVFLFVDELKLLIACTFLSVDDFSDEWNEVGEKIVQTFTLKASTRPNVLTVRGDPGYSDEPPPKPIPPPVPKRISGGVLNGKAISLPKPDYPAAARAVKASGAVNVQVTTDKEGNVIGAKAVSGHPLLRQAAEKAAFEAKFAPVMLSGIKVEVTGVIVYNFTP